jgi:uncharacterized protein (DUF2249 family)
MSPWPLRRCRRAGGRASAREIIDDRDEIVGGDSCVLIVEDDPHYARIMMSAARDEGFKVLVAHRGADALMLARASTTRPRFRSISSCRTCSAGPC